MVRPFAHGREYLNRLGVEDRMVFFEREHVIGALLANLRGHPFLGAERVEHHDASLEGEQAQEIRPRSDPIGITLYFNLSERGG